MTETEQAETLKDTVVRHKRIRLAKKLLRPMPRKTNLHRYPVLKYFHKYTIDRTYLWEFRRNSVISGIWIGWFIALIPIYSLQMLIAFILCIPLRGNALIAMLLQWISNPLTLAPLAYAQYMIGDFAYRLMGGKPPSIDIVIAIKEERLWETLSTQADMDFLTYIMFTFFGGGAILAVIGAAVSTAIYIYIFNKSKN